MRIETRELTEYEIEEELGDLAPGSIPDREPLDMGPMPGWTIPIVVFCAFAAGVILAAVLIGAAQGVAG